MTGVFSGALAYEFTQEPNNYGLIDINGTTATIRKDFVALRTRYKAVTTIPEGSVTAVTRLTKCPAANSYANLNGTIDLPNTPASDLIKSGIGSTLYSPGKLIAPSTWSTTYTIIDENGNAITSKSIDSTGYTPSNGTGASKNGAGQLRFNEVLFGGIVAGMVVWNGLTY